MRFILFFICLAASLLVYPNEPPNATHNYDLKPGDIASPSQLATRVLNSFCPKVNPVSGEYVEEEADLIVAGCEPLSLRRYYSHLCPPDYRYGSWRINPETAVTANFSCGTNHFASIGEENGSQVVLDTHCEHYFSDGSGMTKYALSNSPGYTNLNSLDPHQTILYFASQYQSKKKYRFIGFVQDGSGRRREFISDSHNWNEKVRLHCHPREVTINAHPSVWTPYQIPVVKEILPNGNIVRYEYAKWQDELYWPSPKLLVSITAYNKDETKKLAEIILDYGKYDWQYKKHFTFFEHGKHEAYYQATIWDVASYTAKGSNGKRINFINTQRAAYDQPVLLNVVSNGKKETRYGYTVPQNFLTSVDYGAGRVYQTTFEPKTHKVTQQTGPYGVISRYAYYDGFTEVYDGENNKTIYRYDDKKRMTACENGVRSERYQWDANGRLAVKTIESPSGVTYFKESFKYDEEGNILEETLTGNLTGSGKEDSYTIYRTYEKNDPFHLKRTETDGFGKRTAYFYKPGTNLLEKECVYQDNQLVLQTAYEYDDCAVCIKKTVLADGFHKITTIKPKQSLPCFGLPEEVVETTGDGLFLSKVKYTYHPSGKIETEAHYDEAGKLLYTIANKYDEYDRLISTKNPYGSETRYIYDLFDNLLSKKTSKQEIAWEYDLENRPVVENHSGLKKFFTYDRLGRVEQEKDETGCITTYQYDVAGRVTSMQHPDGGIEQKEYDPLGNVIKETDPQGHVTIKTYTLRNQIASILHPDGTSESFTYFVNGFLKEHTDRNGVRTVYTRNIFGNPTKTEIYAEGKLLKTLAADYTPFSKLSETDAEGVTTTWTYDQAGRKTSEKKGDREIYFAYDALGRLTSTQVGDTCHIEEFDFLNRLTEKRAEDLSGAILFKENYVYDEEGNRTHVITCEGVTKTAFDSHNLPTEIQSPDGHTTRIFYSYEGCFSKTTVDPKGIQTVEIYDPCKRLKEILVKGKSGEVIQHREFTYDKAGHRIQSAEHVYEGAKPLKTIVNKWEYGPMGRVERLLESDQKETRYVYDEKGRLKQIVKPDGVKLNHAYDSLGRLSRLSSSTLDVNYGYAYDLNDRITYLNGLRRFYDIWGNIIEERLENGHVLKSTYDPYGKRKTLTLPNGTSVQYAYQGNFLHEVSYNGLTHTYKERNQAGKITGMLLPNNLGSVRLAYDSDMRVKEIKSPYYSALGFAYDPKGCLTHYRFVDALGASDEEFAYDDLCQLISEKQHSYSYDSLYNRLVCDEKRCTVNDLCQVTHDGEEAYQYDANGNLIKAGDKTFTYDSLNRLTSVHAGDKKITYTYDGLNRRLTKKMGSKKIDYIWDGKNEIGTSDELRILGEGLGAEIGSACFVVLNKKTYIPIHDHRGSLVTLADLKGKPVETYRYSAFGEELTSGKLSPWRFLSKRTDEETGFIYFGRRFYSPALGRWITPDPIGFEDGFNLYAYVHNCPLTAIDLYGEWAFWQSLMRGTEKVLEFTNPCMTELNRLPSDASYVKRGLLVIGAAIEILSYATPVTKGVVCFTERAAIQIGKGFFTRQAEKQMVRSASKTAAVSSTSNALGKGAGKAAENLATKNVPSTVLKPVDRFKGPEWKFPENPADFLPNLTRDAKGHIYPSSNMRIRPEKHSFEPGDLFNPRHHNQHYHVERKIDSNRSWRPGNIQKFKPKDYHQGDGTGFLPGEYFPGLE